MLALKVAMKEGQEDPLMLTFKIAQPHANKPTQNRQLTQTDCLSTKVHQ